MLTKNILFLLSIIFISIIITVWFILRCQPNCDNKDCGDDGCGGSCGSCKDNEICKNNKCSTNICQPNCDNKDCGDDGCGGSCGPCKDNEICKNSKCIETLKPPYYKADLSQDDHQISIYINNDDIVSGNPFYVFQEYRYETGICYSKVYYQLSYNILSPYSPPAGMPDDQYCECIPPSRICKQLSIGGSIKWLSPKSFEVNLGNNNSILFNLVE